MPQEAGYILNMESTEGAMYCVSQMGTCGADLQILSLKSSDGQDDAFYTNVNQANNIRAKGGQQSSQCGFGLCPQIAYQTTSALNCYIWSKSPNAKKEGPLHPPVFGWPGGAGAQCDGPDGRLKCQKGICLPSHSTIGSKACFEGVVAGATKRQGMCPKTSNPPGTMQRCQFDVDCNQNLGEKCCPLGKEEVCLRPIAIPRNPTITKLMQGKLDAIANPSGFATDTTIGLIQSNGRNILFDTGGPADRSFLIKALLDKGLYPEDIDLVVTSHGHPDHYGNVNLFQGALLSFSSLYYQGTRLNWNPLGGGSAQNSFSPLNDPNLEIRVSGGHTNQDTVLYVKNTGRGTEAFAGDMVISQQLAGGAGDKMSEAQLIQFQTEIACKADWIWPGHGAEFRVTDTWRTANKLPIKANCPNQG